MMKKEIRFIWGSEKTIKITEAGRSGSFFYEAYRQAAAGIAEIVRASTIYTNKNAFDPFFPNGEPDAAQQNDNNFYNYPNNMMAFTGERGAGKSSAMLSFVQSLQNKKSKLYEDSFLEGMTDCELPGVDYRNVSKMLHNCEFISLPPIDPTTMENGDQILTVILARMYQLASDTWEEEQLIPRSSSQEKIHRKNTLIKRLSVCYEHICAIKEWEKKSSEYDGLDVLADLGDASRLKGEFTELVDELLRFKCFGSSCDPYLVIQVDDTDMNIEHAYDILEDIRKYLVIPRVIVVMAADLVHLKSIVENSLLRNYHCKMDEGSEYADTIAQQYITKLFPQTRQINLPVLGAYFKGHIENITIRYDTLKEQILPEQGQEQPGDVQKQIFRLIYRKTGLVFLEYDNLLHYIIPSNMRLCAHFLAMLVQMKDVEDPDETPNFFIEGKRDSENVKAHRENLSVRLQNVQRFRDYFLTTWATNNLDKDCVRLISELEKADVSKKTRFVCSQLWQRYEDNLLKDSDLPSGQYSYVDMVQLCRYIEDEASDENDSRFIFAIETYFSLLGHEIALEELIDFYEGEGAELEAKGCSFLRLYPIYGSHLFPYSTRECGTNEYFVKYFETGTGKRNYKKIASRWNTKKDVLQSKDDYTKSGIVQVLFSLLADYMPNNSEDDPVLDIFTPVLNCLYVNQKEFIEVSPLVKKLRTGGDRNLLKLDEEQWLKMRRSALLIVLNWDVQSKVGKKLLRTVEKVKSRNGLPKTDYKSWPAAVREVYTEIVSNYTDEREKTAINALSELDFSGWLNSLKLEDKNDDIDKGDNYVNIEEMGKALSAMCKYISSIPKKANPKSPSNKSTGKRKNQPANAPAQNEGVQEDSKDDESQETVAQPAKGK